MTCGMCLAEHYEVRWIPTWARILDVPTNRHKELLNGVRTTLERLKAPAKAEHLGALAPFEIQEEARPASSSASTMPGRSWSKT
ncbi:MAG: hypothetical protein NVSMB16_12660 [Acidimicrobiales bacterium]